MHLTTEETGNLRAPSRRPGETSLTGIDRLVVLAARLTGAPQAHLVLADDLAHLPAVLGHAAEHGREPGHEQLGGPEAAPLGRLALAHAGEDPDAGPLVLPDTRADARSAALACVRDGGVGAYLAVPVARESGRILGVLGVLDTAPRSWSEHDRDLLEHLVTPLVAELEPTGLNAAHEAARVTGQLAVAAAGIGTFDWDLRTGVLDADEQLLELLGTSRTEFDHTIEAFEALAHPADRDRLHDALTEAVRTGGNHAADYRVLLPVDPADPDELVRWVTVRGRALAGPDGTVSRVLGAAFDSTEAHAGETRLARVLETMPTAFFQLGPDWRFSYANAEAERVLRHSREQLNGSVIWELFPAAVGSDFETHYRGAMESGQPTMFDAYYPPPLDAWYEVRAWPHSDGLAVYFNDVTSRRQSDALLDEAVRRSELLAGVSDTLTGTLDAENAVARLARLLVPELADWCLVTLVKDGPASWRQRLEDVGWWHADPDLRPVVDRYASLRIPSLTDDSFVAQALEGGRPVLIENDAALAISRVLVGGEARALLRTLDPESGLVVPLRGRGRTVGLVSAFRGRDRAGFSEDDRRTMHEIAARAGLAIDNARLYGEQRALAEGLQRSLLTAPPEPEHLEIAVRYEPAGQAAQVGGDWYDAFVQRDGDTVAVIGDVVGHDIAAAAAMGQLRSLLRGIAVHTGAGPAEVLCGVDQAMETLDLGTTATAIVARIEQTDEERAAGTARLRWSSAGHPPPVLIRTDGTVSVLAPEEPNLLLGFAPDVERAEAETVLGSGDVVLFYTDGLVEERDESIDESIDRLADTLTDLTGMDLETGCDELLARMRPERREDDVALLVIRLR
ncbi:SpoIIE family protein phosphatase [Nocardioides sp. zg-DK7169]|uniref:SpoIIE family protein phosphatase n=1 Tax=Nocardioides sp. zg-DK7169 TaxID=2736600 RepID=UPI001552A6B1|nr:SpoIIE family protein phosphatase [Nocardioides sp. zg-DK7169]NPC96558.1 SpoIIE family protein phosphatase [Nocardioides sp. zg-DK7169]